MLKIDQYLQNMPSLDPATHEFEENFSVYFRSEQYLSFGNQMARIAKRFRSENLLVSKFI